MRKRYPARLLYLSKHDLSNAEVKEGDLLSEYVEITEVHPTANGEKYILPTHSKDMVVKSVLLLV